MSKHRLDNELRDAYKSLKLEQPLPVDVKQRILQQAKQSVKRKSWHSWWYFSQLALGCAALVLVLSWVNPAKLPAYYQIDTLSRTAPGSGVDAKDVNVKVQWHHLTASSSNTASVENAANAIVQQRLKTLKEQQRKLQQAGQLSSVLHRQVGLLTQHDDIWQIALCDNLQLNVAIDLVQELAAHIKIEPVLKPQWVEMQFTPSGHILAIAALPSSTTENQCGVPQQS